MTSYEIVTEENGNQDNGEEKDSENNVEKGNDERIKCLRNKLQWTQTKLCESRNTCATLRQEFKKAQKVFMFLSLYKLDRLRLYIQHDKQN